MPGQAPPATPERLRDLLAREAADAGFCAMGVTAPGSIPEAPHRLRTFLEAGRHAGMEWMESRAAERSDPRVLWPQVRSIVMLGMDYGPDEDPRTVLAAPASGAISVYARHRDYHDVVKGKLKHVAGRFAARTGHDVKVFVDTAPVMEKPLAQAAGLGWQGKHTNLVSRDYGSWLFLGSIFTDADIAKDRPERDHCGSCRACLDSCPTDAFPAPYQLDARRCISYLTIEHKDHIAPEYREAMGNRIYGCDDCLAACPWNKFAQVASEMKLRAREDLRKPSLSNLLTLDDAAFRALFSGSPIKRIGRDRFLRNVLIAAGNSRDPALAEHCHRLLADASPLVRAMAVWALARLAPGSLPGLAARNRGEADPAVLAEWSAACSIAGARPVEGVL